MKTLYSELNSLLSHLEAFNVVQLVEEHFARFGNSAPPNLLQKSMDKLQERLRAENADSLSDLLQKIAENADSLSDLLQKMGVKRVLTDIALWCDEKNTNNEEYISNLSTGLRKLVSEYDDARYQEHFGNGWSSQTNL